MASYSDILFGKIAVSNGLVTATVAQQALTALEGQRGRTLCELLLHKNIINRDQAQRVQRAQALTQFMRAEKLYARVLLDRRLVNAQLLRECFARQRQQQHKVRLGQLLMERRTITAEQNEQVIDEQLARLSEETARIEEGGLAGADVVDQDDVSRQIEDMLEMRAATDLDGSTFKNAVGPRGLLESDRTAPAMNADAIERTLEMPDPRLARPGSAPLPSRPAPLPPRAGGLLPSPAPLPGSGGLASPISADALVGRTIASRYRVLEKIGEGGMGTVYRAEHCLMEKIVALKVLHSSLVSSKASLERFRREIRAASKFQHKNVVQIYDAGEGEGGIFYMAMEYAAGDNLEDVIKREGQLPIEKVNDLLRQSLGAIAEAHKKGIVHRDLKSGNIMLVKGKEGEDVVKVMDFGIAKMALESSEGPVTDSSPGGLYKTQEGVVTGTPQYMSPEQASGEAVDGRADLYSLGVILFEMMTGELPFKSNTPMGFLGKHIVEPPPPPSSLRPGIPRILEDVTLRLLEKKPDQRYQSAEDVLAALEGRSSSAAAPAAARPAAPLTMTMEMDAPVVTLSPGMGDANPVTQSAPALQAFQPPAQAGPSPALVAGILAFLILFVTVIVVVVVVALGGPSDDERTAAAVSAATAQLESDPQEAIRTLEALLLEVPGRAEATALLADAKARALAREEAAQLATEADDAARRWRQSHTDQDADAALGAFASSLGKHADPAVQERKDAFQEEVKTHQNPPVTPVEPPKPPVEPPKQPETTPPPADPLVIARDALRQMQAAIQAGKLDEASAQLAKAEKLLPADHTDLIVARRSLEAATLVKRAAALRANDPAGARKLIVEALDVQPDRQAQAELRTEIAACEREATAKVAREAALARRDQALERALTAGVALDVATARAALGEARAAATEAGDDAPVKARAAATDALEKLAPDLRTAREALAPLLARPDAEDVTVARVRAAITRLEEAGAAAGALQDPPLARALQDGVAADVKKARDLEARVVARATAPPAAGERLASFRRAIERVRALPAQHETKAFVEARLNSWRELKDFPAYRTAPEEKAIIDERVTTLTRRKAVWDDLGAGMVLIPGGNWQPPRAGAAAVRLPDPYYAGATEVTCAEWDAFLQANAGRRRPAGFLPSDEPMRSVSLADAEAYCRWRSLKEGKPRLVVFRLPTEDEWERAARGPQGTEFPWGPQFEDWRDDAAIGGQLKRVKTFPLDHNEWGLFDVVGNVQELTSSKRNTDLVVKGGSIALPRAQCGAGFQHPPVKPGDEVSPTIGLRVFAVER